MSSQEHLRFKRLRRNFWLALGVNVLLAASLLYVTLPRWLPFFQERDVLNTQTQISRDLPFQREVRKIIAPLRYSSVRDFTASRIRIALDFEQQSWTLENIHRYDENENILLADGRYGICGELAIYAYQKILPLFEKDYNVRFMKVAESGYFRLGRGTHVILKITSKARQKNGRPEQILLLDPAYSRYGGLELFEDYYPIYEFSFEELPKNKYNETYAADGGSPVMINEKAMLLFLVKKVEDKFDSNNYSFTLSVVKRYGYLDRPIYKIEKADGVVREWQEPKINKEMFKIENLAKIQKTVKKHFLSVRTKGAVPKKNR